MLRSSLSCALSLVMVAGVVVGCQGDDASPSNCFIPAGTYEVSYTNIVTDCDEGLIQPWTEQRELTEKLRCGDYEETKEKHLSGVCFETCTSKETADSSSIKGTLTCHMGQACLQGGCKYTADISLQVD